MTDRRHHRHCDDEQDRYRQEPVSLQPPAQQQRAHGTADLKHGTGERDGRGGQLGGGHQRRRPAEEKEVAHQVEREQQPQQRRDDGQALAEQELG